MRPNKAWARRCVLLTAAAPLALGSAASGSQAADTTPPAVTFRPLQFTVGTQLSDSSARPTLPATLAWSQYDASGICEREAYTTNDYVSLDYVSLDYVAIGPRERAHTLTLPLTGFAVGFNDRDCVGNSGANSAEFSLRLAQENVFTYSAGWRTRTFREWSAGGILSSTKVGATARHRFSGSSVALIGVSGTQRGSADVYIDGRRVAAVSEYIADPTKGIPRGVVFAKTFPRYGTHTIKIVATTSAQFDIDGIVIS